MNFISSCLYHFKWLSRNYLGSILIIFLTAVLIRLFFYHTPFWRTPDAVEYINIARNFSEGRGFVSSIKFTFFTNDPVIVPGIFDRPFLVPFIFSIIIFLFKDIYILQLFNFVFGAISIVFFYLLARKFLTPGFSFIISILVALNPEIVINNRMILSEPIYYCIILGSFVFYFYYKKINYKFEILGLLSGLSFLTRPDGLLLLITFLIFGCRSKKQIFKVLLSFFITVLPIIIFGIISSRNPFITTASYQFRVHNFSEGMQRGFGITYPTVIHFVMINYQWILRHSLQVLLEVIRILFSPTYFGFLIFLFPIIDLKRIKRFYPLIFFAISNLFIVAFSWGVLLEERHLGISYLLFIFIFGCLSFTGLRRVIIFIVITISFIIYIVFDVNRIAWARYQEKYQDAWDPVARKDVYDYINSNTSQNDIIASPNPFMVNLFTKRPSILIPDNILNEKNYTKYISLFRIKYIIAENKKQMDFLNTQAKFNKSINEISIYEVR